MIGSVTNQLNKSVDKYIVSGYETGSLSTVYFAQQFYAVIVGVLVVNIALYYYPKICDSINLERQRLSSLAKEAMFLLTSISLVVTFFTIFYGRHILQLIFQYGQISSSDVDSVYVILCIYTIGLVFEANSAILKRILWADKKTKAVMFITITTVVLNVILSLFLSRIFNIYGVIAATVFTNFMCLVILAFYCKGYITFDSADVKFFIYSITTTMMVFLSIYFAELQYHDSLYIDFFSFLAFIIVSLMLYKQWSKKFVT
jgi:peptidoglycan biosynthesis protein MviN/MurJ (putative lipid II flippase)